MPPFTVLEAATPCRHCPEPAYAVWHLPRGLGHVALCRSHWSQCIGSHGRTLTLIPAGACAPRRVDDDPHAPPSPELSRYRARARAAEGRE